MRVLAALLVLLLATTAQAQQRQPANVSTLPTSNPQEFDLLDNQGRWLPFGTGSNGVFTPMASPPFNVKQYLPPGQPDGTTDNSAQIQALVTSMCAQSPKGGTIYFPTGSYTVHDVTVPCSIYFRGQGVNNTQFRYTGTANFAIQWQAPSFPAFCSQCHIFGAGVEDIAFNYSTITTNILVVEGVRRFYGHNLAAYACAGCQSIGSSSPPTFTNINNFLYSYGVSGMDLSNISVYYVNGTAFNFYGDIAGQTGSGAACATSSTDCSTRSDFIVMRNISTSGTSAATGVSIQGFIDTIMGEHFALNGYKTGLSITCQSGLAADLSQCPQFILLDDFQNEFCQGAACLYATDFVDLRMHKPYFYGNDNVGNNNAVYIGAVNYAPAGKPKVGQVTLQDGLFFSVQNECILVGGTAEVSDVKIIDNKIYGCNTANGGYAAINLASTAPFNQSYTISGNTFCHVGEYSGSFLPSYALIVGSKFSRVTFEDNLTYGCVGRLQNNAAAAYSVMDLGNLGPGNAPTLSACGAGPAVSGSDEAMLVTVGTGSPASCTVTFGTAQWHQPSCAVMAVTGAGAVLNYSGSASSLTFNGTALSGSYSILCRP